MNLQTKIDFDLKGFFQWWGRELAFLVPRKIRQFLSDRTASLLFSADESGFTVRLIRGADSIEPVFARHFDYADREGFQNLKNQYADLEQAEYVLQLNTAQALAKMLYLPEAALENLQQVVGFELDRYTPFKADQAYFTAAPLAKTGQGQVQVLLVLTPQAVLEGLLAQLNHWGVQPIRVEYQPISVSWPQLQGQCNLLPDRYRPNTGRLEQSVHWLLNGALLVLLLAAMIYPVWQEKQAVDRLKTQIKALEKDTRVVEARQLEIDALQEETQRLIDIKTQTPEMAAVLNELSHLLKDDTWLTNLQYSDKHLQIQGQSPMASALIGLLEASAYFSKVSFVSPLTQDKTTGMERFQISMEVNPKPADPVSAVTETGQTTEAEPSAPTESRQ